ncbi:hypothetical protein QW060_23605 [Myroides ceti]|uniref:Uncharacterized protein n=1 Tax=Paenimyroides ceti TaxID=395087 RepID=A0ABT8D0K8_9FLAO|nr:hypothetical protein [Paenimyroides ceti]MDN3709901.1 hypothetical protein [Paenimyroides ceti]
MKFIWIRQTVTQKDNGERRTINLSFTYRFNQKKAEKPGRNGNEENGGEEYM